MCHSLELSISLQRHIFQFSVFSSLLFHKHVPMVKIYLPKRDLSIILPILLPPQPWRSEYPFLSRNFVLPVLFPTLSSMRKRGQGCLCWIYES